MNARRRLVLRVREGHWLAAVGLMLILILAGCTPLNAAAGNGDGDGQTTCNCDRCFYHGNPPGTCDCEVDDVDTRTRDNDWKLEVAF